MARFADHLGLRYDASMFFVNLFGHADWTVFSQIPTKDQDTLLAVLTRQQVHHLLTHILCGAKFLVGHGLASNAAAHLPPPAAKVERKTISELGGKAG
jgi:hypothetical protein